jgi:hypothetical protein
MRKHFTSTLNFEIGINLFRPFCLFCFFCLAASFQLNAQSCQDASVELSAVVQASPPRITLTWTANNGTTQYFVYRKLKAGTAWGSVIGTLTGADTQFIDSTVIKGVSYEYQVFRTGVGYNGYGYINAGIEIPVIEKRGVIILVVDSTYSDSLAFEINRLKKDLDGDGWKVIQYNVLRSASVPSVKALIVSAYNQSPANTKAVFIIGHVPIPYSGEINVDGHGDHTGAYPADVFYADVNGVWTDVSVNNETAGDPRNHNVPEDGKYDQAYIPTDLELQIGRVDFYNMPSFTASELQLLRNYLNKDHDYRQKVFTAIHRGVVDDNFGFFGAEAFAASGWKNFGPLVGHDNVKGDDYFTTMADSSYLWSYGCGGGWYQGAGGVGSTTDFANAHLQGVFTMLFGSYFGDWDTPDNFLRAPLAQGKILTNVWSGRPHWQFHHMGLGENIGYDVRLSQNNNSLYFSNFGGRVVHMEFLGDPTLRNDIIAPVTKINAVLNGVNADISWTASVDSVLGYNVYRKSNTVDDYTRLNQIIIKGTAYTDTCIIKPGVYTYLVRAINLQTSPSGTYYNLSEGISDTVKTEQDLEVHANGGYLYVGGGVVIFSNTSLNATNYLWLFGDGDSSILANPSHLYTDGDFATTLIASNGCDADTIHISVSILTGVNSITPNSVFSVYPNPSSGKFNLTFNSHLSNEVKVKIYSATGSLVYLKNNVQDNDEINLTNQPAGIYLLNISSGDDNYIQKIMIQK